MRQLKSELHPRSKHGKRYDFSALINSTPGLSSFVSKNKYGDESIDFANPEAVRALNKALLKHHYGILHWDIPQGHLCPPVPGRADYLHYLADLIGRTKEARILDIGVGANCIYPLIGQREYGWHFVGSDINPVALKAAQKNIDTNGLNAAIELRLQENPLHIFKQVIVPSEIFTASICNPPFHSSQEEALEGMRRKSKNLGSGKNFGGQSTELWCAGGERAFVERMVIESAQVASSCQWFTTLVSKKESLPSIYKVLKHMSAMEVKTINMAQGQKSSRIVAWTWKEGK